jgi:signal transduction histidine kinase
MSSTIGKTLTHVETQLINSKYADSAKSTFMIKDATATLSEAMEELRDISRSMSSELIKHYGLLKALEFELEPLKRYNIHHSQVKVIGQFIFLRAYEELIIFRIIQEGIKNIVKHSKSSSILISLSYHPDNLSIEISDKGIGFKKHTVPIPGKGLSDIERRTRLLNGTMKLINDFGAILKVDIPITEANSRRTDNQSTKELKP